MIIDKPTEKAIHLYIKEQIQKEHSDFLILCGEDAPIDYNSLITSLNKESIQFCGGIFPSVIHNNKSYSDGVLVLPVVFENAPVFVFGLDNGEIEIPPIDKPSGSSSIFILADGLSNWISRFTYKLYHELGSDYQVFGSGCGYGSFERKNCLFNHEGFFKDAAIVVSFKNQIKQSIRHGWETIAGPYIATKTSANLLEQINWKPAYAVYKSILEEQESIELTRENYYDYAKHYPFGIYRADGEYLIRDPVGLEENDAIKIGAEIPSNAVLYLMKSGIEEMLIAGQEACQEVINNCENPTFLFVVDCISRTWILDKHFDKELENITTIAKEKDVPVYGVFSMGEISSAHGDLLDYHHKTIVISAIEENE